VRKVDEFGIKGRDRVEAESSVEMSGGKVDEFGIKGIEAENERCGKWMNLFLEE